MLRKAAFLSATSAQEGDLPLISSAEDKMIECQICA